MRLINCLISNSWYIRYSRMEGQFPVAYDLIDNDNGFETHRNLYLRNYMTPNERLYRRVFNGWLHICARDDW